MTETEPLIKCPECGSKRIFKDGFRKAPLNAVSVDPIQRYRCAEYGHRWSKHLNVKDNNKGTNHVSANLGAKNMVSTQESKTCADKAKSPTENELKAWLQIEKFLIQLQNDGRKAGTILSYRKTFKRLLKDGADLFNAENTKAVLAKSDLKEITKHTVVGQLGSWFNYNEIPFRPPKYSDDREVPYIPTEQELDLLIAALGKKTACFCQLLKETGARCGEIAELDWLAIDWEQKKIRIKAEKGSNSRISPTLSQKAIDMLAKLPRTNRNPKRKNKIFANADDMRSNFFLQKKHVIERQANPKLMLIHFHTFRHFKGTMEQHRTHDVYHVKQLLGHKSVKSTETYIHIEEQLYSDYCDKFVSKIAHDVEEAAKLVEDGFDFVTGEYDDGGKIFRKRK